jgi:hypothetical protein
MAARSVRQPPEQAAFDGIDLKASTFPIETLEWWRLARVAYPGQFYASTGSRLTPISRKFPCLYIGESQETVVAEIWGDRFYAHRELGHRLYAILESEARQWQYLLVKTLPKLKLCDLTDAQTLLATGFDAATLYDPNLKIPQGWAEVIAQHSAGFDGILYRSRHTHQRCIVAWVRTSRPLDQEFAFGPVGPFLNSMAAYSVASTMKLALSFVS